MISSLHPISSGMVILEKYRNDAVYEAAKSLMNWAKANPSKDAKCIIKDGMKKLRSNEQKEILKLIMG